MPTAWRDTLQLRRRGNPAAKDGDSHVRGRFCAVFSQFLTERQVGGDALIWAPKIPREQRDDYERSTQVEIGEEAFRILELWPQRIARGPSRFARPALRGVGSANPRRGFLADRRHFAVRRLR